MNADAPTAHKLSPNLKLFLIIVAAIIVALAAFTIGKSLWDSHEASVAQAQAAEQAAQQGQREQLQRQYSSQLSQLSSLNGEAEEIKKKRIDIMQGTVDTCDQHPTQYKDQKYCDDSRRMLAEDKDLLKQKIDQYDQLAATVPGDALDYVGLPGTIQ